MVLTIGLAELVTGLGTATLDAGGHLTAAEARRLAYDPGLIPLVLGADSMPLDVGRQQRLASTALRDALGQRDTCCAFPGCRRPRRYCEAHHIVSWLDGGVTTPAATQKSPHPRPSTSPEHHSTAHSDNE